MIHDREFDPIRARLPRPPDADGDRALAERQAGEDALKMVVACGIRAERCGHVGPVQLDGHVGARDPCGDRHLYARGAARHEFGRARHHAQRERAVAAGWRSLSGSRGRDEHRHRQGERRSECPPTA